MISNACCSCRLHVLEPEVAVQCISYKKMAQNMRVNQNHNYTRNVQAPSLVQLTTSSNPAVAHSFFACVARKSNAMQCGEKLRNPHFSLPGNTAITLHLTPSATQCGPKPHRVSTGRNMNAV